MEIQMPGISPNLNFDNERVEHVPYSGSVPTELTWEHVQQPKRLADKTKKIKKQKPSPAIDPVAYKKFFDKFG